MWDKLLSKTCWWLFNTFPSRARRIPCEDGISGTKLVQFMIWPNRLYLQHFMQPEQYEYFHNHRWGHMRSFILSGSYVEERPESMITHGRFTTHTMDDTVKHRVHWWSEHCWTLFYMGEVVDPYWSFFHRDTGNQETWAEHIPKYGRVANLETGELTDAQFNVPSTKPN